MTKCTIEDDKCLKQFIKQETNKLAKTFIDENAQLEEIIKTIRQDPYTIKYMMEQAFSEGMYHGIKCMHETNQIPTNHLYKLFRQPYKFKS